MRVVRSLAIDNAVLMRAFAAKGSPLALERRRPDIPILKQAKAEYAKLQ
jgi:hypothetical protein